VCLYEDVPGSRVPRKMTSHQAVINVFCRTVIVSSNFKQNHMLCLLEKSRPAIRSQDHLLLRRKKKSKGKLSISKDENKMSNYELSPPNPQPNT
jgi:hypothetical protein